VAGYSLVAAIVIRFVMSMIPSVGILQRDARHVALRGDELQEALELMGIVNSRLILMSWPLFAVVTMATRAGELGKKFTAVSVPVIVATVIAMCLITFLLPTRLLRGYFPPFAVTVISSILDGVLYFLALDPLVSILTV
jgi:hypothetical protein